MEHDITLPLAVRTDLALEAHDYARAALGKSVPGVTIDTERDDGITVTRVSVTDETGARAIGKQPGTYVTLEVPGLRRQDTPLRHRVAGRLAQELEGFFDRLGLGPQSSVLVIGLGNAQVTPDALGPLVVENLLVTRHLFELAPEQVAHGYRPVSALAPGVLGTTGIETSDIVLAICRYVRPDAVIVVDALAARALERVNTTIQIADTGIQPGSGVGNKRKPLDRTALGVPVLAIGVPTVVDAATIAYDAIDYVLAHLRAQLTEARENRPARRLVPGARRYAPDPRRIEEARGERDPELEASLFGAVGALKPEEKRALIAEVLQPLGQNLIVTPKEVDAFIGGMANVLATGLNMALHEAVDGANAAAYTY